jgi:hypothetical protein
MVGNSTVGVAASAGPEQAAMRTGTRAHVNPGSAPARGGSPPGSCEGSGSSPARADGRHLVAAALRHSGHVPATAPRLCVPPARPARANAGGPAPLITPVADHRRPPPGSIPPPCPVPAWSCDADWRWPLT